MLTLMKMQRNKEISFDCVFNEDVILREKTSGPQKETPLLYICTPEKGLTFF